MNEGLYIIYMPRVAAALRTMGFKIVKVVPNEKKPQYDAYVFKDDNSLRKAIPIAVNMAKR